ncbi:unnamed protein product [Ceutorhynchus assimilis]|uniref:CDV3 homolog n=1 Tax=Ceutorhynchus assimilis TaxID=467358 RepID=A0A9N9QJK4_9CUCU|nr:unnamed protein product [Ceutorhynchus assimilis]
MADLDDFFAKKDRKKKTTSKKFATTEEVAKKLEDTAKKTEKQKKERVSEGDDTNPQPHEQDEWKEFEEEKKDYTGLKIGNLTINANQDNIGHQESGSGDQQEGLEHSEDAERKSGPWNRMDSTNQAEEENPSPPPKVVVVEKPTIPEPSTGLKTTYKPPALVRSLNATSAAPARLRGNRGAAPDIHNEDFFPTLSGKKKSGEGAFEVVQQHRASSYKQHSEQSKGGGWPKLSLGNRYNTLSSNDS